MLQAARFGSARRLLIAGALTLTLAPQAARAGSGYTATRYPIVLVPGAFGFNALFGLINYFFTIPSELRAGGAEVYVADISSINSNEVRGEQLVAQIQQIVAVSGAPKVNLIGHSMGGLTARYAAAVVPDLVASVTTVATPNTGADLADLIASKLPAGSKALAAVGSMCNALANFIGVLSNNSYVENAVNGLDSLTSVGVAKFNATYPAGMPSDDCGEGASQEANQRFYSWGGTGTVTTVIDPSDTTMTITSLTYSRANDGLVDHCSSHFGVVLRDDYLMNHLDGVNQTLGLVSPLAPSPVALFRAHANRLKNAGL